MSVTLKSVVQGFLKGLGLYYRMRTSRMYDIYWMVADRRVIDAKRAEVDFYRRYLEGFQPGELVFDIGANEGQKTDVFLRMGARVVAVEPDEHSQEVLKRSFLVFRILKPPVVIVGKAVSDRDAIESMWIDAPGSAKNTLNQKWVELLRNDDQRFGVRLDFGSRQEVETVCMETLIAIYGMPFFIKIDVEGHEPAVIRGLRRAIPYLSFEVNLPEFRPEGRQCIELLGALAPDGRFNYAVECQQGFLLEKWVAKQEFLTAFSECGEKSIEVFWKAPSALPSPTDRPI